MTNYLFHLDYFTCLFDRNFLEKYRLNFFIVTECRFRDDYGHNCSLTILVLH